MKLVQAVLKSVARDKQLQNQGDLSMPLMGLAQAYNDMAQGHNDFIELSETSTGRELMLALSGLELKDKVALLHIFKDTCKIIDRVSAPTAVGQDGTDALDDQDRRLVRLQTLELEEKIKFRALARKVVLFAIAPIPPLIVGAMIAIAYSKGHVDSALADGLMRTATEMLKLIFTN